MSQITRAIYPADSRKNRISAARGGREAFELRHHLLTKRTTVIRQIVSKNDIEDLYMGFDRAEDAVIRFPVAL